MSDFVHLHVHSHYSTLDGIIRLDSLCRRASALGMEAIALTDHGNCFGLLDFQEQAQANKLRPIHGCEFYLAPESMSSRPPKENRFHLVLLAENNEGYNNLCKLSSMAYIEGFHYKPRIDKEVLAENSRGLIITSACMQGEVAWYLRLGKKDQARAAALSYQEIAGRGNFYIEIMDHGIPEQKTLNRDLVALARELDIPLIATNDVHFLEREDYEASQIATCIGTGAKLSDPDRFKLENDQFYLKTADEMRALFGELPDALSNTVEIARRCIVSIETVDTAPPERKYKIPVFETPDGLTENDYLRSLCEEGLAQRYTEVTPALQERLDYELSVISQMGFSGYFLIVWDLVHYARTHDIPVGPGRGSAAGSLVSYTLRITDIEPIRFNLFFERFLNPSRISMPDIDMDFCVEKREQIIDYIRERYGASQVAQIVTYQYIKAKAAIKDVSRVLEIKFNESNEITALIPDRDPDPRNKSKSLLEKAIDAEPRLREIREKGGVYETLFRNALKLENVIRGTGKHAAGVVIAGRPLVEYLPLYKDSKSNQVITQYDGPHLEKVGLLKMDILGLQNLTTMEECRHLIHDTRGIDLDFSTIPFEDEKAFTLLQRGQSLGVFQLDSPGMQQLLRNMKPDRFDEIIALIALYRPGPLNMGMHTKFCDRKAGREPVEYILPETEPVLKDTYGIIIYQEQVMQISQAVGGFSMAEADELRKAMGKKKMDIVDKKRNDFLQGAKEKKINTAKAEELYNLMAQFAEYGFNKSHSAAYAIISWQTAWLKANYPLEYMAALLTSQKDSPDKLELYIRETQSMGITILPPDVNFSTVNFSVENNAIRYGLSAIKGIGLAASEAVVRARDSKPFFHDLVEFCAAVDLRAVTKRVLETLVSCGAFASTGKKRSVLFESIDASVDKGTRMRVDAERGQINFFDEFDENSGPQAGDGPSLSEDIREWSEDKLLSLEKELLGTYITGHPFRRYLRTWKRLGMTGSRRHASLEANKHVSVGGIVRGIEERLTKEGKAFGIVTLEDPDGNWDLMLFSNNWEKYKSFFVPGTALCIQVSVSKQPGRDKPMLHPQQVRFLDDLVVHDLHITIGPELSDSDLFAIREELLSDGNRGDSAVYFHIEEPGRSVTVQASQSIHVKPDEQLLGFLRSKPGVREVSLE
ncbi:MAG TPA: DNA polymerase III subunit alpha [Spirochaetota bacterium]|nr:DNA polymerase III subunit alpha [Spirochaetota bacterium]